MSTLILQHVNNERSHRVVVLVVVVVVVVAVVVVVLVVLAVVAASLTFILQQRDKQVDNDHSERLYGGSTGHRVVTEISNCSHQTQLLSHTRQLALRTCVPHIPR